VPAEEAQEKISTKGATLHDAGGRLKA
jgi:hypothetical protein